MASTDPISVPGTAQAALVRTRQVSARELALATLDRIDKLDGRLGAFLTVDADQVLADADEADRATMSGRILGALHGVPVGVKDLMRTRGLRTTWGSAVHEHHVPDADAPVVDRLRQAGAIVLGKTNTPEFGLGAETWTRIGPRASNPYDLARTTGGSSGGAAASIAAGLCSIGLGSDAGGSIRLPGAWCGVAGLKPTYGRVPVECSATLADHPSETIGPMARSIADLALVMDVIAGWHPNDPVSARVPVPGYGAALAAPRRRPSVGCTTGGAMGVCDTAIEAGLTAAAGALEHHGHLVDECEVAVQGRHPFLVMFDLIAGASYGRLEAHASQSWDALCSYTQEFLAVGSALSAAGFTRAVYEAKQARAALDRVLDRCDVLMLPVTAVLAWPHGEPPATVRGQPPAEFGGIAYGGLPYLALASITGHPAMTVPVGLSSDGLPLAVQLIGRYFDEGALLQVAASLEEAIGVTPRPSL